MGQAPTRISFFLEIFCFFCVVFLFVHVSNNFFFFNGRRVGVCGLDNPSFSRIFGIFLTSQDPLVYI